MSFKELIEKSPHKTAMIALLCSIITPLIGVLLWMTGIIGRTAQADYSSVKDTLYEHIEMDQKRYDERTTLLKQMSEDIAVTKNDVAWIRDLLEFKLDISVE